MIHSEEVKKAWGKRYDTYKNQMSIDGWVYNYVLGDSIFVLTEPFDKCYKGYMKKQFDYNYVAFRPSSLSNIKTNHYNENKQ